MAGTTRRTLGAGLLAAAAIALGPATTASHAAADCPEGFECSDVTVPLDRSGRVAGTLDLKLAVSEGEPGQPVLLMLGGGPGQAMVALAPALGQLALAVAPQYRVAFVDQRGTGATALECPEMQEAALTDLTVPPSGAVAACGRDLRGQRKFYATTDSVADIEAVRRRLGVQKLALQGTSYGTYVAERYARAHPDRVERLVLDSVVPQEGVDPLFVNNMRRAGLALRQLCNSERSPCAAVTRRPIRDLHRLVRRTNRNPITGNPTTDRPPDGPVTIDPPALFDLVVGLASFNQEAFARFPAAVKRALRGRPKAILRMAAESRSDNWDPDAASNSWGLHTATLCSDARFPWPADARRQKDRRHRARRAAGAIPAEALRPFSRATAAGNGALTTCLRWPGRRERTPKPGPLPAVPTLILNGSWDLSTPIEGARRAARRSPTAQLVKVPQGGHSVLTSVECAQLAAYRFYADEPLGEPCRDDRDPGR